MPYTFSPSSLSLLKDCPRCFYLHFNKGIKRPAGIFPSLPSGMDGVLKNYFDSFLGTATLPAELHELDPSIRLFDNKELLTQWRSNFKGIQSTDEEGNLLRGAVDNILLKDGKLIVLDYKTRGYPLKDDTASHYQDQLDFYNFLLRKNGYETEPYAYLLFYHPDKVNEEGAVLFHTDLVKMDVNTENAKSIFRKALETLRGEMPEPSQECEYCRWATSTGQPFA